MGDTLLELQQVGLFEMTGSGRGLSHNRSYFAIVVLLGVLFIVMLCCRRQCKLLLDHEQFVSIAIVIIDNGWSFFRLSVRRGHRCRLIFSLLHVV